MSATIFSFFPKRQKGFSTGEVILSMFVLAVGLIAVMNLISASLRSSLVSREVIIAAELAQEGVELVRNVRDNDFAAGNSGFAAFSNSAKHCRIDYRNNGTSIDCQPNQGSVTRYNLQYVGGLYGHFDTGSEKFSRYIRINYNTSGPGNENALVRSFVFWGGASLPPPSGDPSTCTPVNFCVFTELYLTSWKN